MRVRELIEMLAKTDWNSKVSVITDEESRNSNTVKPTPKRIMAISQSTATGVQLVIQS